MKLAKAEFSGRSSKAPCPPGQEFSAFGFISFMLIGINLFGNIINNLNSNSNDNNNNNNNNNDNNNNNNLNMNTGGRKKKSIHDQDYEYEFIGQLVDESKFYKVSNSSNKWDRTMKIASHLTNRYVEGLKLWDTSFCNKNDFVCNVFL